MNATQQTTPATDALANKTIIVTKAGEEGGFEIDAMSGVVLGNSADLPAWAEGCANALLAERHIFYSKRLGDLYTPDMQQPDTLAFEDLAWLKVNELDEPIENAETGYPENVEMVEQDADHEFRAEIIAGILGVAEDIAHADKHEGEFPAGYQTADIATDDMRSEEEIAAMEEARVVPFSKAVGGSE